MYSASPSSSTEPPVSWLALRTASMTLPCVMLKARSRSGSSTIWYWRTMPPMLATSDDVRHGLQFVLEKPVLQRAQLRQVHLAAAVDQRVFVDPAHAGGIRAERGLGLRRQPRLHLVQVFEHARARPVGIGAVLEQDVDEGIAEERIAAHCLRARHRQHGGGERIGDLVLDDLRRLARIGGADDDLHVRQIRNGIERRAWRPPTRPRP